jgi:methionine synthase II (cobalamin-independent)
LSTTIVGSLPKPSWLASPQQLYAPWWLEGDALRASKDFIAGVIDVGTAAVKTPEQVAQRIRAALPYVARQHLHPGTDSGLVPRSRQKA